MTDTDDMIVMEEGDVVITAASELVDSSYRAGEEFLWGYYFCIENNSDEKITLLGKNWNITDDSGRSFCDDSDGFSGEIPELEPGEYFESSATAPLKAAHAVFYGSCKILKGAAKIAESVRLPVLTFDAGRGRQPAAVLN